MGPSAAVQRWVGHNAAGRHGEGGHGGDEDERAKDDEQDGQRKDASGALTGEIGHEAVTRWTPANERSELPRLAHEQLGS